MPLRDICLALLVTMVWGLNYIAAKWSVQGLEPLLANSVRFAIVAVVLSPFIKIVPSKMKQILLAAFMLGVVHFCVLFMALKLAGGVGAVAIAAQLFVPFSTLLAVIILKERVGWRRVVGITLSFAGVLLIGLDPQVFTYWDALLVVSLAALIYSMATIMMRQLKEVPVFTLQGWIGLVGCLGSCLLSLLFENGQIETLSTAPLQVWVSVFYSALGSSIAGHGAVNFLLRRHEVSVVSPYLLTTPLFAVVAGMLVFDETLTWRIALGGTLTIVGVVIVTLRNRTRSREISAIAVATE